MSSGRSRGETSEGLDSLRILCISGMKVGYKRRGGRSGGTATDHDPLPHAIDSPDNRLFNDAIDEQKTLGK